MIKEEFILKNLTENYKLAFNSVWNTENENEKSLKQIKVILKHLEKDRYTFNNIITSLLISKNIFENFLGAYLGICFNINTENCVNKFRYFYINTSEKNPQSLEAKIHFYVNFLIDKLKNEGYISAYENSAKFYIPSYLIDIL